MTSNHQVFKPDAIQVAGNPNTETTILSYRMSDGSSIGLELEKVLLEKTLRHLAICAASCPVPEIRRLTQLFAIRNIDARLEDGHVLTLHYETEIGVSIGTTIDREDALRLRDQLSAALDGQQSVHSTQAHWQMDALLSL